MITPRTPEEMCHFLVHTLIPDLRESGMHATADDFTDCSELIARYSPCKNVVHAIHLYHMLEFGVNLAQGARDVLEWAMMDERMSDLQEYLVDVSTAKALIEFLDNNEDGDTGTDHRRSNVEALIDWMDEYQVKMGVAVEIRCKAD